MMGCFRKLACSRYEIHCPRGQRVSIQEVQGHLKKRFMLSGFKWLWFEWSNVDCGKWDVALKVDGWRGLDGSVEATLIGNLRKIGLHIQQIDDKGCVVVVTYVRRFSDLIFGLGGLVVMCFLTRSAIPLVAIALVLMLSMASVARAKRRIEEIVEGALDDLQNSLLNGLD